MRGKYNEFAGKAGGHSYVRPGHKKTRPGNPGRAALTANASLRILSRLLSPVNRQTAARLRLTLLNGLLVTRGPRFLVASDARQVVCKHKPRELAFDTYMSLWRRVHGIVQRAGHNPEFIVIRVAHEQA